MTNPAELQKIRYTVEQLDLPNGELTVDAFTSGDALLCDIKKRGGYDLLILDIFMPGMNGMELAKEIRANGDDCRIIFLTSSPDFAVESYRVKAYYYLLKPWSQADFASLIGTALHDLKEENGSCVIVKNRGRVTRLRFGVIEYIESDNHKVWFHLRGGSAVDCSGSLNDFQDTLLTDRRFVKCHKSFLVNMDFVSNITNKDFILTGNQTIPISRNIYRDMKSAYFDYFFKKGLVMPQ